MIGSLLYGIAIVLFYLRTFIDFSTAADQCLTPYERSGYCVPLLQCASLIKLLHTSSSIPANRAYLRASRCGSHTTDPKHINACCPLSDGDTLSAYDGCDVSHVGRFYFGDTFIDQYPWTARLIYRDSQNVSQSICSGALINSEYVLTAAHCVHETMLAEKGMRLNSVLLGEFDLTRDVDCISDGGRCADAALEAAVGSVHIHDNYTAIPFASDDIALIRLKRRIARYTDFVRPICITDDASAEVFRASVFTAIGWGFPERGRRSDTLLAGNVEDATATCGHAYRQHSLSIDATKQLCAGGARRYDTCYGNSGAPLMQLDDELNQWFLLGIVSFGPDNCNSVGRPAVYTRVRGYHFWIIQTMFKLAL